MPSLTFEFLKSKAIELPELFMCEYEGDARILSVEFEPVTGLDIFYSDGDAQHYVCFMKISTETPRGSSWRKVGIYPDGRHSSLYGFPDPVFGKRITETLKQLAAEQGTSGQN